MTKKKPDFFVWLRSGLRSLSRKHAPLYEALAAAKHPYKGSNPRQRFCYKCACCGLMWSAKEVALDHREDAGSLKSWEDVQGFMQRLFCGRDGIDVLCHICHDRKTYATRHNVSLEEAQLQKDIIAACKHKTEDVVLFINSYDTSLMTNNALQRKKSVETIMRAIE
jgi:hypothetical protein